MLLCWLLLLSGLGGPGFVASPTQRPIYPTCHVIGFPLTLPPAGKFLDAGRGSYTLPPETVAPPLPPGRPAIGAAGGGGGAREAGGTGASPVLCAPGSPSAGSEAGRFGAGEGSRACMLFIPSRRRAMFALI